MQFNDDIVPFLKPKDVATILNIDLYRVLRLLDDDEDAIPCYCFGRSLRIKFSDLVAWMKGRRSIKEFEDKGYLDSPRQKAIINAKDSDLDAIKEIYRRAKEDEGIVCYLCGNVIDISDRHVDHVIPVSRYGRHSPENLKITHSRCNLIKKARLVEEIPEGSFDL